MLDFLRRGIKTWVAKALFALLVMSFAVWGIGDVFSGGLGQSVATVGDQKISAERYATALNQEVRTQSQRFGQPIDAQTARALGLDRQVLMQMTQEATLDQAMEELGVSAPDEAVSDQITSIPAFRSANGGFDQDAYRYQLAQGRFTIAEFEEATRRSIARTQLAAALSIGGAAPAGAADTIYAWETQVRRFDFFALNAADHVEDPGQPTSEQLAAYHEENAQAFTAPEKRTAVYLRIALEDLAKDFEPDEAALKDLYDLRSAEYDLPETRALYQVVFDTEEEASEAATGIETGDTDFDAILEARGETRDDVSLGELTAGELTSAVGQAAFAAETEGVVGPIDTGFGFAIVDVAAITPATVIPLEDARGELIADLRREAALDQAPEVAGQVDDLRAAGSTLEEIGRELGMELREAVGVASSGEGAEGFAAERVFLSELFAAEEGEERDLVETPDGGYFVLRLDGIEEPALRPLDDVRDIAIAGWRASQSRDALLERAAGIVDRLDDGELMAAIADEIGEDMNSEGPKTRRDGWIAVPGDVVTTLFDGEMGAAASGLAPGRADAVVIAQVVGIDEGPETDANKRRREELSAQLDAMAGEDALLLYMSAKQAEAGLSINQQVIESIITQTGY